EELVWVTSRNHHAHEKDIVPLALSQVSCSWRKMSIAAMEASGRDHRIAYVSSNSNAVASMVLSGMAVAAIPRFIMHKGMRVLTQAEGFKPLGEFDIGLLRAEGTPSSAIDALACHITESFSNLQSTMLAAE
ncbi:MAG TPA: LysR family transcriptional regulator, partial [Devosia sp.]|nr:LysR family transcriptional regulator [Devosia sp.]